MPTPGSESAYRADLANARKRGLVPVAADLRLGHRLRPMELSGGVVAESPRYAIPGARWFQDRVLRRRHLVRPTESIDLAKMGVMAGAMYGLMGIAVPQQEVVTVDGIHGVAALEMDGLRDYPREGTNDIMDGFVADVFLGNDEISIENVFLAGAGAGVVRMHTGNGPPLNERMESRDLAALLEDNPEPARLFAGRVTDDVLLDGIRRLDRLGSDADIRKLVREFGLPARKEAALIAALLGRRRWLRDAARSHRRE